jgi:hypothetical protein
LLARLRAWVIGALQRRLDRRALAAG